MPESNEKSKWSCFKLTSISPLQLLVESLVCFAVVSIAVIGVGSLAKETSKSVPANRTFRAELPVLHVGQLIKGTISSDWKITTSPSPVKVIVYNPDLTFQNRYCTAQFQAITKNSWVWPASEIVVECTPESTFISTFSNKFNTDFSNPKTVPIRFSLGKPMIEYPSGVNKVYSDFTKAIYLPKGTPIAFRVNSSLVRRVAEQQPSSVAVKVLN